LTPTEKELAAAAYRRAHMSWREIGKRVGVDKDAIRKRLTAQAGQNRSERTSDAPTHPSK